VVGIGKREFLPPYTTKLTVFEKALAQTLTPNPTAVDTADCNHQRQGAFTKTSTEEERKHFITEKISADNCDKKMRHLLDRFHQDWYLSWSAQQFLSLDNLLR